MLYGASNCRTSCCTQICVHKGFYLAYHAIKEELMTMVDLITASQVRRRHLNRKQQITLDDNGTSGAATRLDTLNGSQPDAWRKRAGHEP